MNFTLGSMTKLAIPLLIIIVWSALCRSQSSSGIKPQFEVASVKPCDSHIARGSDSGGASQGRIAYNCQSLMSYIRTAYGTFGNGSDRPAVGPFNIVGGPAWINTDLYRIDARAEGSPRPGTMAGPMMQALLEDRFKLKIHKEIREVPVYALVLIKGGPKLPAAKVECWTPDFGRRPAPPKEGQPPPQRCGMGERSKDGVEVRGSTMAEFCVALAHTPLHWERRKVVDKTGVMGRFDFDLKFPVELTEGDKAFDDLDRLQVALGRVGLQLKSEKGQDEFIVIDHAERPSAN